jgi:hypothetical protein
MSHIVLEVVKSTRCPYSRKIVHLWFNEFHHNSYKGWGIDARGSHERVNEWAKVIIADELLETRLKRYVKFSQNFSLNSCVDWIRKLMNDHFKSNHPLCNRPIHRSVLYRWLLRIGCAYKENKKTYYTDRHEDKEVVE